MDHIPGASIWDPKGEGVLTIARKIKYTPCPQCPGTQIIEFFKYFIKLIYLLHNLFLNLQCFFLVILLFKYSIFKCKKNLWKCWWFWADTETRLVYVNLTKENREPMIITRPGRKNKSKRKLGGRINFNPLFVI